MPKSLNDLAAYWKAIAGFFGGALVPIIAPLTQGDWPDAADYRMALGLALSVAFFVGLAPKNRDTSTSTERVIAVSGGDSSEVLEEIRRVVRAEMKGLGE
jgi:hypothetical protein